MSVDKFEVLRVFNEIETYLGYLKGNELAGEYLTRSIIEINQREQPPETASTQNEIPSSYRFPCPDGQWAVAPHVLLRRFTSYESPGDGGPAGYALITSLQEQADAAWQQGPAWARGLAYQAYGVSERILEPDVDEMAAAIGDLKATVIEPLAGGALPDWAAIGKYLIFWQGGASASFFTFYSNYGAVLRQMADCTTNLAAGYAVVTQITHQTQLAVLKFAESVRDLLKGELDAWVIEARQPLGQRASTDPWIGDVAQVAKDAWPLLDHVPVVNTVKGYVDDAVDIAGALANIAVDVGVNVSVPEKQSASSTLLMADEIEAMLTDTLRQDYAEAFQTEMDRAYTGGTPVDPNDADADRFSAAPLEDWLAQQKRRDEFGLPEINDDSSMYSPGPY